MIQIPKSIKLAGVFYTVERPEKSFISGSAIVDGTFSFTDQKLRVSREGSNTYQQIVFLHETIHGLIANYCPDILSFENEEKLVEQLSKGLYQFICDNPEVFANIGYSAASGMFGVRSENKKAGGKEVASYDNP